MNNKNSIKIKALNVLIDLEETLTDDHSLNNYASDPDVKGCFFGGSLRDLLIEKFDISRSEAMERVKKATEPCGWFDPYYAVTHSDLGISREEIWQAILAWQEKHVIPYEDAVYMVKKLYKEGFNLYMSPSFWMRSTIVEISCAPLSAKVNA